MNLVDGPPDPGRFADALHSLTDGRIGALRRILGFALLTMLEEKTSPTDPEAVAEEHIGAGARRLVSGRKPQKAHSRMTAVWPHLDVLKPQITTPRPVQFRDA